MFLKKEIKKKLLIFQKEKDTGCKFKNSDLLPTTYSFIEQQHKSYCEISTNDANRVAKFQISRTYEINADSEKDMLTQIVRKNHCRTVKR